MCNEDGDELRVGDFGPVCDEDGDELAIAVHDELLDAAKDTTEVSPVKRREVGSALFEKFAA